MIDIKRVRFDYENVERLVNLRGKGDFDLPLMRTLDATRRLYLSKVEGLKAEHNKDSKKISKMIKSNENAESFISKTKTMATEIKQLEAIIIEIEAQLEKILLEFPNLLKTDTPVGNDETMNILIRKQAEPRQFHFEPKSHWELGLALDLFDFDRATKITGTRFTVLKGMAAKFERILINYMIDIHVDFHGYTEILPPYMVNRDSLQGTGQLPKFESDMFYIPSDDFFMIPTAEVPVTNLYRDELIDGSKLPIYHVAYSPCFRKEAGSAGKDTKGIIRQHQFNKVELVKFVSPDQSYQELESLTLAAEEILKRLKLPYRVVRLCGGEVGFSSAMTYDIEVWLPSYNAYKEISSCSNYEDYQSRRANIRFRDAETNDLKFVHTLNGSGLAIGRTLAAIFENYQNEDGSISIPEVLVPYFNGKTVIK